jgi:hypothetical protein
MQVFYYNYGGKIMSIKRVPIEQQYLLVMECRQSGLSDRQWCMEQDVVKLDNLCKEETIIFDTDIIETNETSDLKFQSTTELSIGNTDIRIINMTLRMTKFL